MYTEEQIAQVVGPTWAKFLWTEFNEQYMLDIMRFVKERRQITDVYPASENVFRAYKLCPLDKNIKVIIVGQDPYHTPGMADGLAFSTQNPIHPPSLTNIISEMEHDLGFPAGLRGGNFEGLAKQGVFLINTSLTVEKGQAGSHSNIGWQNFTIKSISLLRRSKIVIICWGQHATNAAIAAGFNPFDHDMLTSSHPSPFSAYKSFFGNKPFSKANRALINMGKEPIDWSK